MQIEPTLVDLTSFTVVGLSARFISPMSPDGNNQQIIPPLWAALDLRITELLAAGDAPKPEEFWGLCRCLSPAERSREDELEYLAGVRMDRVSGDGLPAGMVAWEVPATRYARFTHRGPIAMLCETMGYVYGTWFPRSAYEPTFVMELEHYDHRFKLDAADSELDCYVGLRARG